MPTTYTLPDLPYDHGALEPHYSAQVLQLHHDKHHAAYVKGVNDTMDKLAEARASEDFGSFGTEWGVPSVFWYVGGTDRDLYTRAQQAGRIAEDIPTNHNPRFAPVIHPTLEAGIEAMTTAAVDALVS